MKKLKIFLTGLILVIASATIVAAQGVPRKTTKARNEMYTKKKDVQARDKTQTEFKITDVKNNPKHRRPGDLRSSGDAIISEPGTGFSMKSSKYNRKFNDRD